MLHIEAGRQTYIFERVRKSTVACVNCRSFDLKVKIYKECFHFYYLPLIPLKTSLTSVHCKNCGRIVFSKQIEEELGKTIKTPIWFYSGIILIGLLAVMVLSIISFGSKKTEDYFLHPKKGDVYHVSLTKFDKNYFFFYKLIEIKVDTFVVYPTNGIYRNAMDNRDRTDYFDINKKTFWLTSERDLLFESGAIIDIQRND